MSARDKLYAYAGTPCVLPESMLDEALDAYRAEVLAEADLLPKADVVAWLIKKSREFASLGHKQGRAQADAVAAMASKADRGAVRPNNLRTLPATFFEAGHTYTREHHGCRIEFHVRHIDETPNGTRFAFGFRTDPCISGWAPMDSDDMDGWTDTTEGEGQ
jgi:hypothetical protein